MAENARKPRKNINVPCLVLAIVFCLALIASICTYFYAASGTEIFTKVGFGATLQNSRIMVDDENDMTFLGTYANTIIGVDAEGNHVWTQPISGAVGAMEYDTDNDWLIVGSQDRNVYVFNSLTGELLMQYPVNGKVDDLDYDQASKQILVSSGVSATKHTLAVLNLETGEELFSLSLRNTALKVKDRLRGDSAVYEDFGEMLFTHFGISGPMVLSASSRLGAIEPGRYTVELDLKPALDEKMLDIRLLSDFAKYSNRDMANALGDLLPRKLIPVVIRLSGIPEHKKINTITREERQSLLGVLKHLTLTVEHARPIEEAIVTSGGVAVGEIDPRSMESRIVPGLYFTGEVIDVDAYTGGFNLQIAFSTAALAADSILASQC